MVDWQRLLKTSLAMFAGDKMNQVIADLTLKKEITDDLQLTFRESISELTADDSCADLGRYCRW